MKRKLNNIEFEYLVGDKILFIFKDKPIDEFINFNRIDLTFKEAKSLYKFLKKIFEKK